MCKPVYIPVFLSYTMGIIAILRNLNKFASNIPTTFLQFIIFHHILNKLCLNLQGRFNVVKILFRYSFQWIEHHTSNKLETNHIGGVMVKVLASSAVDRRFEPRSGQTKDYTISICCFFRSKSKDWMAKNNVSEWERHFYLRTIVLVSQHYQNSTQRVGLVQSGHHHHHYHLIKM